MRHLLFFTLILWVHCSGVLNAQLLMHPPIYPGQDRSYPFHDAAGSADTTALYKTDTSIVAWGTGYTDLEYGDDVAEMWQTPAKALGAAQGISMDIVSLGRGGQITLTFANPITDGDGFDFAVFENSFSSTFLELAWVEVSSDGEHFVRFPYFSYTGSSVGGYGQVQPIEIHGFAGKYQAGYGTPFDLTQLRLAYESARDGTDGVFTDEYKASLLDGFAYLNLNAITHVRLIDVVGDGSAHDVDGNVVDGSGIQGGVIYDPYKTFGSTGFDLDAVAVIHQLEAIGSEQSIDFAEVENRRIGDSSFELSAAATSNLPVSYVLISGPALINGSTLTPTGLGQVVLQAIQAGDATYAAASPVTRSFYIADELQHIFFEPVSNQILGVSSVALHVVSSSGLPVTVQVVSGAADTIVSDAAGFDLAVGSEVREVVLSATQAGDGDIAPAAEVLMRFQVVEANAVNAPRSFSAWQAAYTISGDATSDSDLDGVSDFEEYAAGTDPTDPSSLTQVSVERIDGTFVFNVPVSLRASVGVRVQESLTLAAWTDATPELLGIQQLGTTDNPVQIFRWRVSMGDAPSNFWQVHFNGQ